jgi:hypothetical protein
VPQLGQARWGNFCALHRGQTEIAGLVSFQAERRECVRMRELFFFGTAMVRSLGFGSEQFF